MIHANVNGHTEISLVVDGQELPLGKNPPVVPATPLRRVRQLIVDAEAPSDGPPPSGPQSAPATNSPPPTLEAMIVSWRKSKEGLKPGTLVKLDAHLSSMRRYVDTHQPVTDYTPQKIREFVAKARADIDDKGRRRLKGQTINSAILVPLYNAFALAQEENWIDRNPMDTVKREKAEPINRIQLKWSEAEQVMEEVKLRGNPESYLELKFMWLLGVGQGEAKDISGGAVDWDKNQIKFTRQKTGKAYIVPIYPWAAEFIRTEIEPLFKKGQPLFQWRNPRKALETACKRKNLPPVDIRSLRRTLIIHLIQNKIDIRLIAKWQGHADGRLIMSRYGAYIDADYEKEALKKLGERMQAEG